MAAGIISRVGREICAAAVLGEAGGGWRRHETHPGCRKEGSVAFSSRWSIRYCLEEAERIAI
jgi:hypothetical protein